MKEVTFPLKLQSTGPEVANLQAALQLLLDRGALLRDDDAARRELSAALQHESAESAYGQATGKVVALFQELRHLPVSGAVDESTAAALNVLLREWGMLGEAPAQRSCLVIGEVRREDGLPMQAVRVRAVHEGEQHAIRLGEDSTDAEGHYTIRYELLPGVDVINLRVSASAEDGSLLTSSDLVREAKPVESIDLTIPISGRPVVQRRIEGLVVLEHGLPAETMKLRLYRREFRSASHASAR